MAKYSNAQDASNDSSDNSNDDSVSIQSQLPKKLQSRRINENKFVTVTDFQKAMAELKANQEALMDLFRRPYHDVRTYVYFPASNPHPNFPWKTMTFHDFL